jgi:hypothetical protein
VELERPPRVAPDPTSQHEHGDSIEISFGNSRERVRQSCSRNYVHRRKPPGSARDSIGHERSALFIGDEDWARAHGTGKRIVEFDVVCARNAKSETHTFIFERAHNDVTTRHLAHNISS